MSDGVTERGPEVVKARASGVERGAAFARRCRTRRTMARVGQQNGWPVRPSLMTSPGTPFFCCVNVSDAEVARRSSSSEDKMRSRRRGPTKSWTSPRVKGVVSELESVYSPGLRR